MFKKTDIRNFYFENERGERIDCQDIDDDLFLLNVSGLGYEESISYELIGNTFTETSRKMIQSNISGDLEFCENAYDIYKKFVDFIFGSKKLKLVYIPKLENRVEFYKDIDITKIDKTEEDEFNVLSVPIKMKATSLWYKKSDVIVSLAYHEDEIKWDFKWDSKFIDHDNQNIIYNNKGHVDSPFQLEISGYIKNPSIIVYKDNQVYEKLTLNVEIKEFEKLMYSSKDGDLYIMKQNTDGTTENLFTNTYINIEEENAIFKLPIGTSKIRIQAENDIMAARLSIFEFYKAV